MIKSRVKYNIFTYNIIKMLCTNTENSAVWLDVKLN